MKLVFLMTVALVVLAGCEKSDKVTGVINTSEDRQNIAIKAQQDAQAELAKMQVAQQKRIFDIQIEVAKQCSSKGNIPLYVNGNVDCLARTPVTCPRATKAPALILT